MESKSPLPKVIQKGKRPLAWVVDTPTFGPVLMVRRTPRAISITTKKSEFKSINESAQQQQAGWALDFPIIKALRDYNCTKVVVHVRKSGLVYITDAKNYHDLETCYSVPKNAAGDRIRCVSLDLFTRHTYNPKL